MTPLGDVYEKTDATTWVKRANIAGPQGPASVPLLVTSLPSSPADGTEVYYKAASTAAGGDVIWHLRYRAAMTGSFKWEFLGGSPLRTDVVGATGLGGGSWLVGEGLTIPLSGHYDVFHTSLGWCQSAGGSHAVLLSTAATLGVILSTLDGAQLYGENFYWAANVITGPVPLSGRAAITAGQVLHAEFYFRQAGNALQARTISAIPARVG